jgi:hypothetical protein
VNTTIDPSVGSATDLDGGGQNDYFLSLSVSFNDLVTQLGARGIIGFDQNSTLSYVIATATQANSLNQDLNGVGKNYDGTATWSSLGTVTYPMNSSGVIFVPETNSTGLFILGISFLLGYQCCRRKTEH